MNLLPTTAAAPERSRPRSGFTLVELLTVIAIIAVLAAIIFPVFSAVSENARRGNTMSNMRQLYAGVKQYELDNRKYPDYLFGPALDASGNPVHNGAADVAMSMEDVSRDLKATLNNGPDDARIRNVQTAYKGSLYPAYINDLTIFGCPDNTASDTPRSKNAAVVQRLFRGDVFDPENGDPAQTAAVPLAFYTYDSYDASPGVNADQSNINTSQYYPRYSLFWLPLAESIDKAPPGDKDTYPNQLGFKNPSADSYLMMTTHHVSKGKIIVMWLNGSVKVLDTKKLEKFPAQNEGIPLDYDMFRMTTTNY